MGLPEEVPTREAKKIEPAASFPSTSVVPEKTATPVAESNQATPSTAATAEIVGVATPPQLSRQIEKEKSNHKTENRIGDPKTETIVEQTDKNDSKTQEIEEKMSNLNTKNETTSVAATPSENQMGVATDIDIEDRPQPPEFDTVPDVDDLESDDEHENATAIVDNDDLDDEL